MVKELTNSNWCENVDGAKELSVVFFYANWCRNCKAVMPVFRHSGSSPVRQCVAPHPIRP